MFELSFWVDSKQEREIDSMLQAGPQVKESSPKLLVPPPSLRDKMK